MYLRKTNNHNENKKISKIIESQTYTQIHQERKCQKLLLYFEQMYYNFSKLDSPKNSE